MILKKLREQHKYSQEQLATMSGISVRTIQRIESARKGQSRASLESLKSIAAVFNITVDELTQEIIMIDKTTENWKSLPIWIRSQYLGLRTRRAVSVYEKLLAVTGLIAFIIGVGLFHVTGMAEAYLAMGASAGLFGGAYWYRLLVDYGDSNKIW